jgi:hypothetical protein
LYQVEEDLLALLDTVDMVPEGTDERLQILDEIAEKTEAAIAKRDNLIRFLRRLDNHQAAVKREIDQLRSYQKHLESSQDRVERYVVGVIEQFVEEPKRGNKRLEGSIGVLSLRRNPARVEVTDVDALPAHLTVTRTIVDADKRAIKAAIEAGEDVPGADLAYGEMRLEVR